MCSGSVNYNKRKVSVEGGKSIIHYTELRVRAVTWPNLHHFLLCIIPVGNNNESISFFFGEIMSNHAKPENNHSFSTHSQINTDCINFVSFSLDYIMPSKLYYLSGLLKKYLGLYTV